MIEHNWRLDKDGLITKILNYCLLNGLIKNFKFCINLILNLDLNGVLLKSQQQEGKRLTNLELKTK